MRIADLVALTLANFGARRAFGMPGGEVLTLIDGLNAAGVRFVLARNENAAAIMAAGASTMAGGPGVLVTTLGPGLANAVNGIADASQEHVPLIVLTGVVDHGVRGRYTHQVIDHRALLRPLVKGAFEVEAEGAAAVVARAVSLAMSPPMGPVLIELAPGTALLEAPADEKPRSPPEVLRPALSGDGTAVMQLQGRLAAARRPLLIAGWDAVRAGASVQLCRLAERFAIPVITTYKAKGAIPEAHGLSIGAAGLSPLADRHLLPLVKKADIVVLAGYDPIEMRQGWLDPFADTAEVIEVTACPPDHGMHRVTQRIEGDIADVLSALLAPPSPAPATWPDREPDVVKQKLAEAFAVPPAWGPHAAIDAVQRLSPPDATVTVDSGAHRILLSQMLKIERPFGLLQSAGFCTMGAAVPLAAGVKSVAPGRPAIAVLGDGGLEMGIGELATLRDEALPVVIVVFQDESLALIELKQRQSKLPNAGVRLGRTAYEDVARAFGGSGARVRSRAEFEQAFAAALKAATFSVIICEIKASDYVETI